MVFVVDAVCDDRPAGSVRPEKVHHAPDYDDTGDILQNGQLHGSVDLRHHTSQIQERADKTIVAQEESETGTGLRREEELGKTVQLQEWHPDLATKLQHRRRGRGRGDRYGRPEHRKKRTQTRIDF